MVLCSSIWSLSSSSSRPNEKSKTSYTETTAFNASVSSEKWSKIIAKSQVFYRNQHLKKLRFHVKSEHIVWKIIDRSFQEDLNHLDYRLPEQMALAIIIFLFSLFNIFSFTHLNYWLLVFYAYDLRRRNSILIQMSVLLHQSVTKNQIFCLLFSRVALYKKRISR